MKTLLRTLGRLTPDIRYLRAISIRTLTALHSVLGHEGGIVDVLGSKMELDPRECVDNGLWFQPHLYDRREREFVLKSAGRWGAFLDVGANIGFWSLFLAHNRPEARIICVEANPQTATILRRNVLLNRYDGIEVVERGVGPEPGMFELYLNTTGNRGGDSFVSDGTRSTSVSVQIERLSDILKTRGVTDVEFMKIDVEGVEEDVFSDLFANMPATAWPRLICTETLHSPKITALLQNNGYELVLTARENSIFERRGRT